MGNIEKKQAVKEMEPNVTWAMFLEAVDTFSHDLSIVGHENDPLKTPFDRPEAGVYYLTVNKLIAEMGEANFSRRLREKSIVIATMCMDKRGAVGTDAAICALAAKNYPEAQMVMLAMGGGAAQEPEIRRPEGVITKKNGDPINRRRDVQAILGYLRGNATVIGEIHTCHDGQCGALRYSHNDLAVQNELHVPACDPAEGKADLRIAVETLGYSRDEVPADLYLAHYELEEGDPDLGHAHFVTLIRAETLLAPRSI